MLLLLACLLLLNTRRLAAAPGDSHWDRQFGLPGTTNRVFALRFNGNNLYASGLPVGAGGLLGTNTGVDIFDGTNWTARLGELSGSLCVIYDFAFLHNDTYVGGVFSMAGDASAAGLARWDGTNWSSTGFAGALPTLASDGTNLYVGGQFTNAAGLAATNVARYDGTNWYALGGGLGIYGSSQVYVLEWHNGLLYAGGNFTNAGSVAAGGLAVWNGTSWSSLGNNPANGLDGSVSALVFDGDNLYAGGSFATAGGVSAFGVARWNGSSWSPLGGGCKGGVNCLGIVGTNVYAGGTFSNVNGVTARAFAKWDGTSWTTWPTTDGVFQYPLNDTPNRMAAKDGSLYIGGNFSEAGGVIANHIVRYDGTNFFSLGQNPANGFATPSINVLSIGQANDGLYVGGLFTAAGKTPASRIARWDGTNWNALGAGTLGGSGSGNRVFGIAGRGNDVFVGGTFTNAGGVNASNIARWNGTNWTALGIGFDATVVAIAAGPVDVYAGGSFTNTYGPPAPLTVNHIARWDGAGWESLGLGVNGTVNALALSGSTVYAGGSFTTAGGSTANRIALWNGSSWSSLGTGSANGLSGTVQTIAINGTDIYVGGSFASAGTVAVGGIAKWDGTNWSGLGSGASGPSGPDVRGLAFAGDGKLYCCGRFTNISGVDANGIARWDGTKWQPLGSGFFADTAAVRAIGLVIRGNDIYAAGTFSGAGLTESSGVARWNETIDFTPPFTLKFSNAQMLPGNIFKARINSSQRATYLLEYSADLRTWLPLLTNSATQIDFTHPGSSTPLRVYRARGIP